MKSYLITLVSLFIFVGCAALEPPVINTEGNTFSSSKLPSIHIELENEFKYLGSYGNKFEAKTLGYTGQTIGTRSRSYLYPDLSSEKYLHKLIEIRVLELPAGRNWHPNTMLVVKNPLKESIITLGGQNFQYCIKGKQAISRLTQQYLLEKEFTTPRCFLGMLFGRVFGSTIKVYIYYYEDISNFDEFGVNSCSDWKDKKYLNEKQNKFLEEFEKRAHGSIKTVKF